MSSYRSRRPPTRSAHPAAAQSSAQRRQHTPQARQSNTLIDLDPAAIIQFDLDPPWRARFDLLRRPRQIRCARHLDRKEHRGTAFRQHAFAHLAPPREQQTRIHVMAGSHIADPCTGLGCLRNNPQLLLNRPATAALTTDNDLDDAFRHGSNHTLMLALRCPAPFSAPRTGGSRRTHTYDLPNPFRHPHYIHDPLKQTGAWRER